MLSLLFYITYHFITLSLCFVSLFIVVQLVMNAMFFQRTHGLIACNKSHIVFINSEQYKCDLEKIPYSQLKCNIQGTFFLSEGSTSERVLKVHAKKYKEKSCTGRKTYAIIMSSNNNISMPSYVHILF